MKRKHMLLPRILLTLLGTALILTGSAQMLLGLAGERATAVVTSVSREGGERDDAVPGQYTYSVGYAFYLPDGREINGSAKMIGGAAYLKTDGTSTIGVRYFTGFPWLSVPDEDNGIRAGRLILIAVGVGLIWLFNGERTAKGPTGRRKVK